MIQSIIVYSLLMGVMLLCSVVASKNSSYVSLSGQLIQKSFWRFETLFPLLLFAVIFGMRYNVGVDYLGYLEGYLWKEPVSKGELLFDLLSEIGWKLNLHFTVYFGILALIQVFFFFYAFKDERYLYPFLVFILFTNGNWQFWMNVIRQSIAMCIWIFSIKYIEENKFWKYSLWCLIAMLFHRSAAVLIIFYPILRNGKDYFKSIPLQLILFAGAFVFKEIFSELIMRIEPIITFYSNIIGGEFYSSYDIEGLIKSFIEPQGTGLAYLFKIILNVGIILYSKKLKLFYNNKRFNIIYFFFFIGLVTLYMFPAGYIAITRPFNYFYIFHTIMYAYFLYFLYKTKLKDNPQGMPHALMFYGLIIVFLGIFYLSQITANENDHLWYQFYFDQNIIKEYPSG
jgi:hypothetical protein